MAKGYCPHSTHDGGWTYDNNYCLSKGHTNYKAVDSANSVNKLIAPNYFKDWCDTDKCFRCAHYEGNSSQQGNSSQKDVFCGDCGERTPAKKFCSECGGKL